MDKSTKQDDLFSRGNGTEHSFHRDAMPDGSIVGTSGSKRIIVRSCPLLSSEAGGKIRQL